MRPNSMAHRRAALCAWLSGLVMAGLCAAALVAWLDPAHALAWVQLMTLCR